MTTDRTITAIIVMLLVACVIPGFLYLRKLPVVELSAAEKELAQFSSQPVALSPLSSPNGTFSGLNSPISVAPTPVDHKAVKSAAKEPVAFSVTGVGKKSPALTLTGLPVVSMISYDESTKMAIIDSRVVSEGSKLDGGVIVKIEPERVLWRKVGKDIWLTIER